MKPPHSPRRSAESGSKVECTATRGVGMEESMRSVAAALLLWTLVCTAANAQEVFEIRATELRQGAIRGEGVLLVPVQSKPVRSVIVLVNWGLGRDAFLDPRWRAAAANMESAVLLARFAGEHNVASAQVPAEEQVSRNANLGGGAALLDLLNRFADQTGRAELRRVPLVLWGFSAAGGFATSFAEANAERTLAFVRYHSHRRGLAVDVGKVVRIPALLIAGDADQRAGTEDAQRLWREGINAGAPWTLLVEPGRRHADGLDAASPFILAWIHAVVTGRLAQPSGIVSDADAWVGNLKTGAIAPRINRAVAENGELTWLPNRTVAEAWQRIAASAR